MITIAQYNPHTYTGWANWAWYQFRVFTETDSTIYNPAFKKTTIDRASNTVKIYKGQ
jgi:hypothetical protein